MLRTDLSYLTFVLQNRKAVTLVLGIFNLDIIEKLNLQVIASHLVYHVGPSMSKFVVKVVKEGRPSLAMI